MISNFYNKDYATVSRNLFLFNIIYYPIKYLIPNGVSSHSFQSQSQYSLFSLGMFTYTYERQDIIQIALKRLPEGGGAP
jgi:hypothetical protein